MKNFTLILGDGRQSKGIINDKNGKIFFLDDVFVVDDVKSFTTRNINDYANFIAAFVSRFDNGMVSLVQVEGQLVNVLREKYDDKFIRQVNINGETFTDSAKVTITEGDKEVVVPIGDVYKLKEIPKRYSKNPAINKILTHNQVSADLVDRYGLVKIIHERVLKGHTTIPDKIKGKFFDRNGNIPECYRPPRKTTYFEIPNT